MTQKALLQAAGDGTVVPDGYVGQRLISAGTESSLGSGTITTNLASGLTLTPGTWIVTAYGNGAAVAPTRVSVGVTNSANSPIGDSDGYDFQGDVFQPSGGSQGMNTNTGMYYFRVPAGSTQIVKARAIVTYPSSGGSTTVRIQAVRIA